MGPDDGSEPVALGVIDELKPALGRVGAGGATHGEQPRQRSSGKFPASTLVWSAACDERITMASGPDEFIGAVGSHRSNAQ